MYRLVQEQPALILQSEDRLLRLYPVTPDAVRITMTGRDHFLPEPEGWDHTPIVPDKSPSSAYTVVQTEDFVTLKLRGCMLQIDLAGGAIRYLDSTGRELVREPRRGGKQLEETRILRHVFSQDGPVRETRTADGIKITGGAYTTVEDRTAYRAKVEFVFGEEALYGFGSHEEGEGNLRGRSRQLYQHNTKACVPCFVSSKGYGFLFDCRSLMTFQDDGVGSYVWMEAVDELDYYFLAGPDYPAVVHHYRALTGAAPMLPKWAFGYGQSKERYTCAAELIRVVEEYRRRKIPLSFVIQDWQSWPEGQWGQKSLDPDRYPDPAGMMARLHELGAALMISIWPNMSGMGENQRELLEQGGMLGNRSTYDAFSHKARDLYWKQAREGLFRYGIDGWWCDCTEPFEADWSGPCRPEPHERIRINSQAAKTYLDAGEWMAYSLCHSRGIYEGQRAETGEKRVVNLTRSSYAGQHRYATITWSGDVRANWETLARQIPEGLNFSASGEPYWNLDIGGFFAAPSKREWYRAGAYPDGCEDLGYRELYTRWLQYATFLPMMRSHGTDTPREIWNFGEEGSPFYDAIARFIRLRMVLLPYLYSLAAQVSLRDGTFLTPLGLAFPDDPATFAVKDQFLLGPSLLVCPVVRPMYYDVGSRPLAQTEKTRQVYLPAGCGWYDFWTGIFYQGGSRISAEAPLDRIPVFVRAGSILPMGPAVEYPAQDPHPELTLQIYPGRDAAFSLYDDEGDSYRYEEGQYTLTDLRWCEADRTLNIGRRQGSYPGMPRDQVFHISIGDWCKTVCSRDGEEIKVAF